MRGSFSPHSPLRAVRGTGRELCFRDLIPRIERGSFFVHSFLRAVTGLCFGYSILGNTNAAAFLRTLLCALCFGRGSFFALFSARCERAVLWIFNSGNTNAAAFCALFSARCERAVIWSRQLRTLALREGCALREVCALDIQLWRIRMRQFFCVL